MNGNQKQKQNMKRWIIDVKNGIEVGKQEVKPGAFVCTAEELPDICANEDFINTNQARLIVEAIEAR